MLSASCGWVKPFCVLNSLILSPNVIKNPPFLRGNKYHYEKLKIMVIAFMSTRDISIIKKIHL